MNREALLALLEGELVGLEHGIARLEVHVRDGRIVRAVAGRERSVLLPESLDASSAKHRGPSHLGRSPA